MLTLLYYNVLNKRQLIFNIFVNNYFVSFLRKHFLIELVKYQQKKLFISTLQFLPPCGNFT